MKKSSVFLILLIFVSFVFNAIQASAQTYKDIQYYEFNKFMYDKASEANDELNYFQFDNSVYDFNGDETGEFIRNVFRTNPFGVSSIVKNIIFYKSCTEGIADCDLMFKLSYYDSKASIDAYKAELKSFSDTLVGKSFDEQIKGVTEYVKSLGSYSLDSVGSPHSAVTLLNEGLGVCQAYTVATQQLLTNLGIDNYLLIGDVNSSAHVWNVIFDENGVEHHLDVTWEDILNNGEYYMISTQQLNDLGTHRYDADHLSNIIDTHNYFKNSVETPEPTLPVNVSEFISNIDKATFIGDLGVQDADKVFSVNFNSNVGKNFEGNVYIYHKKSKTLVPSNFEVKGKSLIVSPMSGNLEAGNYYLMALAGIESDDEPPMISSKDYYITFEIK